MVDKKISELTNITGANLADADEFVVVDTSANETKAITYAELKSGLDTSTGFVRVTGDTMTGNLSFGDNNKAIFGAGSDLQIYHDGSNSTVRDLGAGDLIMRGTNIRLQAANGETYLYATENGAVELNHDNATKLATTSTGVDVTGTVTADGLTVNSSSNSEVKIDATSSSSISGQFVVDSDRGFVGNILGGLTGRWNGTDVTQIRFDAGPDTTNKDEGSVKIKTSEAGVLTDRLKVDYNGDISFYEDTGTTPKLFWDASAEALELTNSAASSALKITKGNTTGNALEIINSGESRSLDINHNADGTGTVDDIVRIKNNGTSVFEIDSSGNVGIGTTSPSEKLHLYDTTGSISINEVAAGGGGVASWRLKHGTSHWGAYVGTTNNLIFYDYGASAERLRIDASGNLLVGTTSASGKVRVKSDTSQGGDSTALTLHQGNFNNGGTTLIKMGTEGSGWSKGAIGFMRTGDYDKGALIFCTEGSSNTADVSSSNERLRIDSSGNVGIGTASPAAKLQVEGDIRLSHNNPIEWGGTAYSIVGNATTGYLQFNTASTERMRIDSSGNLLVGKTAFGLSNTGVQLSPINSSAFTADNSIPLYINRKTSDGTMVEFRKDGTTVGSIGVTSSRLNIGTGDTGIRFDNVYNGILPFSMDANNTVDNALAIGSSSNRFTNLYLSGGVYLGGTGAANKLDDYETGTWTPTAVSNVTINQIVSATYTKKGRSVTLNAWLNLTFANSLCLLGGLPFAMITNHRTGGAVSDVNSFITISNQALGTLWYWYGANTSGSGKDVMLSITYDV